MNSFKNFIDSVLKKIQIAFIIYFLTTILLVCSVAIFFCSGNFSLLIILDVRVIVNVIITLIEFYCVGILVCLIFSLAYFILKRRNTLMLSFIIMLIFMLLMQFYDIFTFKFKNVTLFIGGCFLNRNLDMTFNELLSCALHCVLLSLIYLLMYKNSIKKRRDIDEISN